MAKNKLNIEQKKLNMDLWIIIIASLVSLGLFLVFQNQFNEINRDNNIHILLRVLLGAVFQFGLAGLGITIIAVIRKESFLSHGMKRKGAVFSIVLSSLCFIPYILLMVLMGRIDNYLPFQMVGTTREVLSSGFPSNVIGMLITATAWGFFEGFNYVFISDKINKRYPSKNKWLNWGAIICAVLCILIHGAVGVDLGSIMTMISIMIIIYGMLLVREFTQNSWGCVFIFVMLWNAF